MLRHRILMQAEDSQGAGGTPAQSPEQPADPQQPGAQQEPLPGTDSKPQETQGSESETKLAELAEQNKQLQAQLTKLQSEQKKEQEKKMAEQGEYQKLAEQRETERQQLLEKYQGQLKHNALLEAARKHGLRNTRYLALVDVDAVQIDENETVQGADEAIQKLKTEDPSLFGSEKPAQATPTGTPGASEKHIDPSRSYTPEQIKQMPKEQFDQLWTQKFAKNKQPI